jgi:hypothetical protein
VVQAHRRALTRAFVVTAGRRLEWRHRFRTVTDIRKRAETTRPAVAAALVMWTLVAAATILAQAPSTTTRGALGALASARHASLSGRWELNQRACEPIQSPHDTDPVPPRSRGKSLLSAPSRDEMRRVAEPQPVLQIVWHESHYAVTDAEGHVLILRPDGATVKAPQAWPALDRTTKWDGRELVTEVKLSSGARVTQNYASDDEGFRLVIRTRVEGGHARNALSYKWVYDQALQ